MQPHNVLAIQITLPYKNTSLAQMHRTFLVQYMYVLFNKESNTLLMFTLIWGKLYNMSHKVLVFPWDCTVLSNLFHASRHNKIARKVEQKMAWKFFSSCFTVDMSSATTVHVHAEIKCMFEQSGLSGWSLGSISDALLCLVYIPPREEWMDAWAANLVWDKFII